MQKFKNAGERARLSFFEDRVAIPLKYEPKYNRQCELQANSSFQIHKHFLKKKIKIVASSS